MILILSVCDKTQCEVGSGVSMLLILSIYVFTTVDNSYDKMEASMFSQHWITLMIKWNFDVRRIGG
jgi:hypothetical protein